MTVLVRVGTVAASRRFAFELVKPSSVVVAGGGSESATISALGSVEFSAATALSLNDVFSNGYDNYMVVSGFDGNTSMWIQARMRLSGSDNSTSNSYVTQLLIADNTTIGTDGGRQTRDYGKVLGANNVQKNGFVWFIYGPALAQPTAWRSTGVNDSSSARTMDIATTHNQSTAYDGFTIYPGSGTIEGRIAVYGMRG